MQQSVPKASGLGLTKLQKAEGWAAQEIHLTDDKNRVSELPRCPNCSSLIALYLQGNYELTAIPPLFFQRMALLQVLDLSHTSIKSLPKSLPKLIALKNLLLRGCDLFMELSPMVGKLKNLEELDLDETQIMDLPREMGKLLKLRRLKVSFYHLCGKKKSKSNILIHPETISNLSQLAELSIDVNPADKRWDDCVEAVVKELCNSKTLGTLSLYLPEFQLLGNTSLIYPSLSRFRFIVGHPKRRIISRVPHEVEAEFRNWDKCLKFVNGENIPIEIKGVLKYSTSFFLDHHATTVNLSEFGIENMKGLKFCLLAECNEMETFIDEDDQSESDPVSVECVLESLEYLSIYYMENLQSIWRGPNEFACMSKLKFLALHTCPRLSKIFSHTLLENFVNLEEIILEDCPQVTSLVSHPFVKPVMSDKIFLPSLKRLLLLYLPALVSISSGLLIAPKLERIGCYNCPKLTSISKMELSSKTLKIIKGECQWWEDMNWNEMEWGGRPDYLMHIFSPIDSEKDVMTQLVDDRDLLETIIQNEGQQLGDEKVLEVSTQDQKGQCLGYGDVFEASIQDKEANPGIPATSIQDESQQSGGAEPQTSALEITMLELTESTPLSCTGSPWSGDSDHVFEELDQFDLDDASKKRKTLPICRQHVRVSSETGLEVYPEDGFCWRKYGQKQKLLAKYPRSYYRCTHRAQGCLTTKKVQRTDDDPRIIEITYHGTHTCKQEEGTSIEPQKMLHNHHGRDVRELYKLHSQPWDVHRANAVEDAAEAAKTISSGKGYGDVFEAPIQDKEANSVDKETDVMTQLAEDRGLVETTIENEDQQAEWENQPDYLTRIFSLINNEKDMMTQLAEDTNLLETTIENEGQQPDNEKDEMIQLAKDKDLLETPIENEVQQGIAEVPMHDESQQSDKNIFKVSEQEEGQGQLTEVKAEEKMTILEKNNKKSHQLDKRIVLNLERSKMISSSREAKQEGETNEGGGKLSKGPTSSSSSRQWSSSGFRNPRIVRVSRSFGGKDRHSKVWTVRGLRDRCIRLSVPMPIQLYGLQDRLGFGHPSKVVDWLLEAAKDGIDKLPQLQMLNQFHQPLLVPHESNNPPFLFPNSMLMKDGEDEDQRLGGKREKGKWIDHGNHGENVEDHHQRVLPLTNHSPYPGLLNNGVPLNSYYHREPPNLSSSQFGNRGLMAPQTENFFTDDTVSEVKAEEKMTILEKNNKKSHQLQVNRNLLPGGQRSERKEAVVSTKSYMLGGGYTTASVLSSGCGTDGNVAAASMVSSGGAHDGSSTEGGGAVVAANMFASNGNNSILGDDERVRFDEGERFYRGNRWPRQETLALLKIRLDIDVTFRDASVKGPLWEEVSRKLAELGYHRSAKECKEKVENVFKYHNKTKDCQTGYGDVFEASIQDKEANHGNWKDAMTQLTIDKDLLENPLENEGQLVSVHLAEHAGIAEVPMHDDPDAEVIDSSPKMLHLRTHNNPCKLRQRSNKKIDRRKAAIGVDVLKARKSFRKPAKTTVFKISADTTNFREMVQSFTGPCNEALEDYLEPGSY